MLQILAGGIEVSGDGKQVGVAIAVILGITAVVVLIAKRGGRS